MIRHAIVDDVPALCRMARRFVEESSHPLTFDPSMACATFHQAIARDDLFLLVDDDEGVLCGGIMGCVKRDFCKERCAYLTKIYVEKEFRGLGTSRDLVRHFEFEAKRLGAAVVFAPAAAGMGDRTDKLFVRLFEKFEYEVLGSVLVKRI